MRTTSIERGINDPALAAVAHSVVRSRSSFAHEKGLMRTTSIDRGVNDPKFAAAARPVVRGRSYVPEVGGA